jgi:hypothetical protein
MHADDRPASGSALRNYIWKRQVKSLAHDLRRFLTWLIRSQYAPRGRAWLAARSMQEWIRIKARLDAGTPVPLGLVRNTRYVFANHQVLAIGYDEQEDSRFTILVYDPNCPDVESTISVDLDKRAVLQESCAASNPLWGFFRERYVPVCPNEDTLYA